MKANYTKNKYNALCNPNENLDLDPLYKDNHTFEKPISSFK